MFPVYVVFVLRLLRADVREEHGNIRKIARKLDTTSSAKKTLESDDNNRRSLETLEHGENLDSLGSVETFKFPCSFEKRKKGKNTVSAESARSQKG